MTAVLALDAGKTVMELYFAVDRSSIILYPKSIFEWIVVVSFGHTKAWLRHFDCQAFVTLLSILPP